MLNTCAAAVSSVLATIDGKSKTLKCRGADSAMLRPAEGVKPPRREAAAAAASAAKEEEEEEEEEDEDEDEEDEEEEEDAGAEAEAKREGKEEAEEDREEEEAVKPRFGGPFCGDGDAREGPDAARAARIKLPTVPDDIGERETESAEAWTSMISGSLSGSTPSSSSSRLSCSASVSASSATAPWALGTAAPCHTISSFAA